MLEIPQGAGSGFCWDSKGRIITNAHVIRGASEVQVTFTDGKEGIKDLKAKVLGVDEDKDLAVLTVDPSELTEVRSRTSCWSCCRGLRYLVIASSA